MRQASARLAIPVLLLVAPLFAARTAPRVDQSQEEAALKRVKELETRLAALEEDGQPQDAATTAALQRVETLRSMLTAMEKDMAGKKLQPPTEREAMMRELERLNEANVARIRYAAWLARMDAIVAKARQPTLPALRAQLPADDEWKTHIDWCSHDSSAGGSVDCTAAYLGTYPDCIISGGRSCLMGKARAAARAGNCSHAFELAMICQCHNHGPQVRIENAGQQEVCNYLGPPPPPAAPQRPVPLTGRMPVLADIQFTCIFKNGSVYSAWLNQRSDSFVKANGDGQAAWVGEVVTFVPQPFLNCNGQAPGTPVGRTRIRIENVAYIVNFQGAGNRTVVSGRAP